MKNSKNLAGFKRNKLCLFIAIIILVSCYEKQEGCLDFEAENYDFLADISCDDCCSYPNLNVRFNFFWGTENLNLDSVYTNKQNVAFQILNSAFYISKLGISIDEQEERILETLNVVDNTGAEFNIVDDIQWIKLNKFTYPIGTKSFSGNIENIDMLLGIEGNFSARQATKTFIEDSTSFEEIDLEHTNFFLDFISEDYSEQDTISIKLQGLPTIQRFDFNLDTLINPGVDFTINLKADYQRLLENIMLSDLDSKEELSIKISNELTEFIGLN